jgi:hypothetical protein
MDVVGGQASPRYTRRDVYTPRQPPPLLRWWHMCGPVGGGGKEWAARLCKFHERAAIDIHTMLFGGTSPPEKWRERHLRLLNVAEGRPGARPIADRMHGLHAFLAISASKRHHENCIASVHWLCAGVRGRHVRGNGAISPAGEGAGRTLRHPPGLASGRGVSKCTAPPDCVHVAK